LESTDEKLDSTDQTAQENGKNISEVEKKLAELAARNAELEENLAKYKSDTDRVGEINHDSNHNLMNSESLPIIKKMLNFQHFCSKFH